MSCRRPKQARLEGSLTLPASDIAIRLRPDATDVERAAVERFARKIGERSGAKLPPSGGRFPLLVGVCDAQGKIDGVPIPRADELAKCKNADQAYLIVPLPERGLAIAARGQRGICYGMKTLEQLLVPRIAGDKISFPLVAVLDWPDLEERGEWGGSANRDIEYLADRKMNLIEAHSNLSVDEQGHGTASTDTAAQEKARLHGIKWVPIITHLDQIGATGIYKRYPELKGKGPKAQSSWGADVFAPCFSEPKTAEVLAEWFLALASVKGVNDICVWLSESHVQCGCPKCSGSGQFALEAAACVRAWQLAREKNSNVRLRILLTQGSYSTNDKVLAAASPPEVNITYYDGGRTYDSSRDPMIYPLLEDFARQGRWLGCYPQLTASWRIVCPWSGPQFVKCRMTEFVDKGLRCLCGYATPDNRFYDFNVTAAGEWSWNAHGRSEEQFARAWATRRGAADPEKAARWAIVLGPVGWDVYGSGIPYPQFFGRAAGLVGGRRQPALGKDLFRYFPTVEHVDQDLAACDEALRLAEELRDPAITTETHVVRGYVRMVKAIYRIASAVAGKKGLDADAAKALQADVDELAAAGAETAEGLEAVPYVPYVP